jgi:SAM-dependent methyltransferase
VDLSTLYDLRFRDAQAYRIAVWRALCDGIFSRYVAPDETVLDLGAGWAEFINNIRAARKFAIDLNPDAGARLSADVTFFNQDCTQRWPIETESLDVVFTSNFLEHLPDKGSVLCALKEAFRCLKPGGRIVCLGPNIKYCAGAYWDFWDHHVPISDASMAEVLQLCAFKIVKRIGRFLPYSMSTGLRPPIWMVKTYLKVPLAWSFFGRQFLVVAIK